MNAQFDVSPFRLSPALDQSVQVWSGSSRAGSGSSYDFNSLRSRYVVSGALLSLAVTDWPDPVRVRRDLTYRFTVANRGAVPSADVVLTSLLPPTVSFVSASSTAGDCSFGNGVVTCHLGEFPESAIVSIVVNTPSEGVITNMVSVTSSDAPPVAPLLQTTVVRRSARAPKPLSMTSGALPFAEVDSPPSLRHETARAGRPTAVVGESLRRCVSGRTSIG